MRRGPRDWAMYFNKFSTKTLAQIEGPKTMRESWIGSQLKSGSGSSSSTLAGSIDCWRSIKRKGKGPENPRRVWKPRRTSPSRCQGSRRSVALLESQYIRKGRHAVGAVLIIVLWQKGWFVVVFIWFEGNAPAALYWSSSCRGWPFTNKSSVT